MLWRYLKHAVAVVVIIVIVYMIQKFEYIIGVNGLPKVHI